MASNHALRGLLAGVLLCLLAGCTTASLAPVPAVPLGEDTTPWGVLPRYEQGRLRTKSTGSLRRVSPPPGQAVADVLVDRDGTIRDIRILEATSSGVASAALAMLSDSAYPPLPPDGPERYVVRQTFVVKRQGPGPIAHGASQQDGGGNSNMPANQPWPNLGGNP